MEADSSHVVSAAPSSEGRAAHTVPLLQGGSLPQETVPCELLQHEPIPWSPAPPELLQGGSLPWSAVSQVLPATLLQWGLLSPQVLPGHRPELHGLLREKDTVLENPNICDHEIKVISFFFLVGLSLSLSVLLPFEDKSLRENLQ